MKRTGRMNICVVGAGVAGLATALRLHADGHRVTLLAGSTGIATAAQEAAEIRYYALSPASTAMLEALGVGSVIAAACPYTQMCVWGDALRDALRFTMADAPFGLPALGHIVGHGALLRALSEQASGAVSVQQADAVAMRAGEQLLEIECSDGDIITTDLAVAADGAESVLRELACIDVDAWDYAQQGIVGNVHCATALQSTAWQRFLPSGPLALLPLDTHRASIVWSVDEDAAASLMAHDDAAFGAALTEATQGHLGDITAESPRAAFPLRARHAQHYFADRLALVGDSAHVVHPLAGQGLNLGLADAETLAALLRQYPANLPRALRGYSRKRRAATADMVAVTDGLYRLFGPAGEGFAELRNAGMALVNRLPPARTWLVERALGLQR